MNVNVSVFWEYKAKLLDGGLYLAHCINDNSIGGKHHYEDEYLVEIVILRQEGHAHACHVHSDNQSIH